MKPKLRSERRPDTPWRHTVRLSSGFLVRLEVDHAPTITILHELARDPDVPGPWGQGIATATDFETLVLNQKDIADLSVGLMEQLKAALSRLKGLPEQEG